MSIYGKYKSGRDASWQAIIDYNICSLPIGVADLANKAKISIVKNSDANKLNDTEAAAGVFDGEKWYIIYDDDTLKERIRFSVAHEIGHIFLGHPLSEWRGSVRTFDEEIPVTERQADVFASRLLMPACVLWGLRIQSVDEIMNLCQVSRQAAEIRLERMKELYKRDKFLTHPLEQQVYEQFREFIENNKKGN
jgi:Predicted Zn peptidase